MYPLFKITTNAGPDLRSASLITSTIFVVIWEAIPPRDTRLNFVVYVPRVFLSRQTPAPKRGPLALIASTVYGCDMEGDISSSHTFNFHSSRTSHLVSYDDGRRATARAWQLVA